VDTSNYPFCTIDPNVGVVQVPDQRLTKLSKILKPKQVLPTTIEFVDIAGLVKDAHKGEGLGNQFLSHIREVDAICHVVREFHDDNIAHVSGQIDPKSDQETINLELIYADLSTVEKKYSSLEKGVRTGLAKDEQKLFTVLQKIKPALDTGKPASSLNLTEEELELANEFNLLTLKPILLVHNVDEGGTGNRQQSPPKAGPPLAGNVNISAKLESELIDLSDQEAKEYLKELGLESSGLDQLIKASYKLLGLITFFTAQNNILQAWTVEQNTKAPKAAAKIHTDFAEGFIKADVISWQNLESCGSETEAREKGLVRTEGKEYVVQDGDVIHFKFST